MLSFLRSGILLKLWELQIKLVAASAVYNAKNIVEQNTYRQQRSSTLQVVHANAI